ncbi:MAG: SDR family NAD(P)-dependent oxidoreductase [Rhodospirillales bacterium]|nr:SDR family NAD(P)-dependent oxidoreductase [Rhodospirillales bacterium]
MAIKKKAVVLGVGAEKGLGAAASRRFAKEGYHVLVVGRTAAKIEKVVDSIRAANGSATAVTVDGTREAEVISLWDKAMADDADGAPTDLAVFNRKEKAGADGLLNIAAIADSYWYLHTQHRSAWTHEIDPRSYKEPF